ncbi:MAG: endonuclease MutS2, partial [Clostridia bacterium]|nr:endonuclease MutS2 [Clostridia bacterium]
MFNRDYATLELDKILERLSGQCSCRQSAERLRETEPQTDINEVRTLLEQTWDAHMLVGRFGSPSFGAVSNISNSLRRAQAGSTLTMGELLEISATLRGIRRLREWRSHSEGVTTCLDGMFMSLVTNKFLEEKIESCIISEEEMADGASKELASIRSKIRSAQASVRDKLDKMIRSQGGQKFLQDSIVTMRNGRFVVPVKAEHRSEVPGLVHDTSSSGATVFIEPMGVVETNNEIKVL